MYVSHGGFLEKSNYRVVQQKYLVVPFCNSHCARMTHCAVRVWVVYI